jgi:hypothetical protein
MWQRFTERARQVVFFSQEEAGRLGHNYVATEHLLLGLLRDEDHVASRILKQMGIDLKQIRNAVERQVTRGDGRLGQDMQLTPQGKRVVDLAYEEAKGLDNNYIGTEHLLLGLLREVEGVAGHTLADFGLDLDTTRLAIQKLQADATKKSDPPDIVQRAREGFNSLTERLKGKPSEDSAPTEENLEPTPGRGHIGFLRNDDARKQVEFVPDVEDLNAFSEVMALKDEFAYRDLVREGKLILLAAGTGAKFLRKERPGIYCVRILDGDHAGKIGFVQRQQLKDAKPDDRPFPPEVV